MKTILFLLTFVIAVSCQSPGHNKTESTSLLTGVNVDSLNAVFLTGWNKRDSASIMATLAPTAVVMNDSLIHTGTAAIAANWVSGGVKVLSNIVTTSVVQESSGHIAYDAGTYTLDLTIPNGPVLKERGNYNLIWTKQPDDQWLLTLVHIEDVTRMPDFQ
jgi:ketosteroid isomerase-like protein